MKLSNVNPFTRKERRAHAKPAAAQAGAKGKSAKPLTLDERLAHYHVQNGTTGVTAAQARRANKKANAIGGVA